MTQIKTRQGCGWTSNNNSRILEWLYAKQFKSQGLATCAFCGLRQNRLAFFTSSMHLSKICSAFRFPLPPPLMILYKYFNLSMLKFEKSSLGVVYFITLGLHFSCCRKSSSHLASFWRFFYGTRSLTCENSKISYLQCKLVADLSNHSKQSYKQ